MRRDKINALYYPDMYVDQTTLKKAILRRHIYQGVIICGAGAFWRKLV